MSVRRLAEITIQPPSFAFNEVLSGEVKTWIAKYPEGRQQSAVIPLLMLAQEQEGWISKASIETIADMLKMPYIRALEVATFYTQFQLKPTGSRAHVQVCGTTPCMLRGSEALMSVCREKIHHDQFHLNAAGTLSWEEVECLGACVNAPMVMIFKDTYEDLTPERLAEIIDAFERGESAGVPAGPQNGRFVSTPLSGQTTLLDEQVFIDATNRRKEGEAAAKEQAMPAEGCTLPPSKAARPATDAIETNAAVKSPSPVKVERTTEGAKETEAPAFNGKAADKGEPAAEGGDKERERPVRAADEPAPYKAPELAARPQAGESGKEIEGAMHAEGAAADGTLLVGGVDAVGSAMGSAAAPAEQTGDRGSQPSEIKGEDGPVVSVSDSNTVPPGDDKLVSEAGGAVPGVNVSLDHPDRPAPMERPDQADDLKMISGVGPKIEGALHALGIHKFRQIAGWTERERHWVDGYLRFHGRIERDNWVGQAKALAEGGEDEYFRVFGRRPR